MKIFSIKYSLFNLKSFFIYFLFPFVQSNGYDGYGNQNNDSSKSLLDSANIKKIPLPPLAPPRVPLFSSELKEDKTIGNNIGNDGAIIGTGSGNSNSVSYRPVPPPVRREVKSEGKCHFDPTQWQMQAQSAAANAIMFDRSSGIGCNECLERCSKKFQNHSTKWICRSLTYDHRWKICDLFAVNGGDSPYNLLDFEGRDYFQYMPAFPPTDFEMLGIKQNENNEILEYNNNLTNNNLQCNCPCKAFSELINQKNIPLILNNKTENEEKSDEATNIVSTSEINSTINSTLDNFNSEQLFGTKNIEIGQSLENQFINLTTLSLPINLEQKQLNNQNNSFNNFLENNSSLIQSELFSIISPKNSSLEEKLEIGKSFGSKIFEPQKDVELIEKPFLKQQKIINNSCPKIGQIAYYAEIEGKIEGKKNEKTEKINEIKNSRDCLNICDGKTKTINFCNSAQWTSTEGCELFSNFSTQILSQKLTFLPSNETENAKYFEKVCIDKNILKDENRKTFIAIPGYILVGHVQEVSNAGSLSECLKSCLSSFVDYGFYCKSLMFYPSDKEQNCLMNSESRHTQSDVFVPEEQNVEFMIYLDLDTPQLQQKLPSSLILNEMQQRRFYDSPIDKLKNNKTKKEEEKQTWTFWSKCLNSETADEMRYRYLKCRESKDIRKCPKETIPCNKKKPTIKIQKIWHSNNNTNQQKLKINEKNNFDVLSECRAVRDALGRKKCPYGMRWNGMKREACQIPIDC